MNARAKRTLAEMEEHLAVHYVTQAQCCRFLAAEREALRHVVRPRDPDAARHLLAELDCLVMDLNEQKLGAHTPGTLCERRRRERMATLRRVITKREWFAFLPALTAATLAALPDRTLVQQLYDHLGSLFVKRGIIPARRLSKKVCTVADMGSL